MLDVDLSVLPAVKQEACIFGVKKLKKAVNHKSTKETEK